MSDQLGITVTLGNIAGTRRPLAASAVEDKFLFALGLIKPELLLELSRGKVQRVREDGQGEVDGGWDRTLKDFVGFPHIYQVCILDKVCHLKFLLVLDHQSVTYRSGLLRSWLKFVIRENFGVPVSLQVVLCLQRRPTRIWCLSGLEACQGLKKRARHFDRHS